MNAYAMELHGERLIPASVTDTWAALNDPAVLRASITGCELLERTADDAFTAQVGGKLAQIGSRLIDAAAGKIAEDFFKAFESQSQAAGD